jgi:hypothetical protein
MEEFKLLIGAGGPTLLAIARDHKMIKIICDPNAHLVQLWLGAGALGSLQVRTRLRRGLTLLMEGLQG